MNQESREDYGDEAMEGATAILQGNNKFNGSDEKIEEARAEENALYSSSAEDSSAMACSQRARNLGGYAIGTANKPEEDEEEKNATGNRKQPTSKPVQVSHGWS